MKKFLPLFFTLSLLPATAYTASPQKLEFAVHGGKVDFLSIGRPAAIKIHGMGSSLEGKMVIENKVAKGRLAFDLDSLDTNIDMRNKHMKEKYLETAKYKSAELEIDKLDVPDQLFTAGSVTVPFTGMLSLHGTRHPVQGTSELHFENNKVSGTADFSLTLSDYKIEIPTYMGITVADLVKVTVSFAATGQKDKL